MKNSSSIYFTDLISRREYTMILYDFKNPMKTFHTDYMKFHGMTLSHFPLIQDREIEKESEVSIDFPRRAFSFAYDYCKKNMVRENDHPYMSVYIKFMRLTKRKFIIKEIRSLVVNNE